MDTLGQVVHKEFSYVFVSCDINVPVEVLKFSGKESSFRDLLTNHFTRHNLLPEERQNFERQLISQYEESKPKEKNNGFQLTPEFVDNAINMSGSNYQIIPLILQSKNTNYLGVNCYIDSIGRVKNLPKNARMTRLCSTDIRGDCFLSKTYDDEDVFKRVDFTIDDYNELMENPPSPEGRWDSATALSNALNPQGSVSVPKKSVNIPSNNCENCKKPASETVVLKLCSRCKKVKYCSVDCQKEDWKFHLRICK